MSTVNIRCTFSRSKTSSEDGKLPIISLFLPRCYKLSKNKNFDKIILSIIIFSSLKLVIDTYVDSVDDISSLPPSQQTFQYLLVGLDFTFNGIFIFELLVKVIAVGLILDYETYLRDGWS
jgi:hypothetical protein